MAARGSLLENRFPALRSRDYLHLFVNGFFTTGARWTQVLGQGWLVHELTDSATAVGAVPFASFIPFFVGGPLAGALAALLDRPQPPVWAPPAGGVATNGGEPGGSAGANGAPQVAGLGHRQRRGHGVQRIGGAEKAVERASSGRKRRGQRLGIELPPQRGGMHLLVRQFDVAVADVLVGVVADLLVAGDPAYQVHLAVSGHRVRGAGLREALENSQPAVVDGLGVVIGTGRAHEGLASLPVESLDLPCARLDQVDGALVEGHRRAAVVDFGEHLLAAVGDVDDHEVALGNAAQADRGRRIAVRGPVPAPVLVMQYLFLAQVLQHLFDWLAAEVLAVGKRQLDANPRPLSR